ncbi:hypothetical protein V7266_20350 [Neobacillus drentensis]|uniref:hypothetical protein n=1 Tax=Neobacillus drentensis TaxID=220684 RepID=UPI002FFE1FB2
MSKKLKIYKENGEFVIERINEFNHAIKRFFVTQDGLFEGLKAYGTGITDFQLDVSEELWATVINFLNNGME